MRNCDTAQGSHSKTVVKCAVGVTDGFKVGVGFDQGSALSSFAMVMDR